MGSKCDCWEGSRCLFVEIQKCARPFGRAKSNNNPRAEMSSAILLQPQAVTSDDGSVFTVEEITSIWTAEGQC